MGFSLSTTEDMLAWLLGIGSPSAPAAKYISFHVGDPGADGANPTANLTRTQHDAWAVGTPDDGSVENDGTGETAEATGGDTITHFGVWDDPTAGNFLFGGTCTTRVISTGSKLTWADGALVATIT